MKFMAPGLYPHADPKDIQVYIKDGRIEVDAPQRQAGEIEIMDNYIKWTFPRRDFATPYECGDRVDINGVEYYVTKIDRGIDGTRSAVTLKNLQFCLDSADKPDLNVVKW